MRTVLSLFALAFGFVFPAAAQIPARHETGSGVASEGMRRVRRIVIGLVFVVASGALLWSQEDELVPAPYLAARYTAPGNAPSNAVVAGADEPGERLVVTGRVLSGNQPVAGASLFVFQTDAEGRYALDKSGNDAELDPRLYSLLRTDQRGAYRYETIRPGSYDGNAAHVHYVKAMAYKARLVDLWFADDPILAARRAAGEPEITDALRNTPYFKASSDSIVIAPVTRDDRGVWHAVRDIQMFRR